MIPVYVCMSILLCHPYVYLCLYLYNLVVYIYTHTHTYIYTCNAYTSTEIKVRSLTMIRWALPYITRLPPDDTKAPQRLTLIVQEMAGWTMVGYEKWMKMAPWMINMMIDRSQK